MLDLYKFLECVYHVVWQVGTDILEEPTAAIFGLGLVFPEGDKGLLRNGNTYIQHYVASHSICNSINFMLSQRD
jgi:hypothetical protein